MTKAISKVIFNGDTLMDVTQDTVEASKLFSGYTATGADGQTVTGNYSAPTYQTKSVTPSSSQQLIEPDSGYMALTSVTVNAIPSEYIIPNGTIDITENGTINVSSYASAEVNVPVGTDTQDATAIAEDIYLGKTAYVASGKVTGTGDLVHTAASVPVAKDTNIVHVGDDYYAWRGGGNGGGTGYDVIFIDYDGTELYHFSKAEINAMTSDSDLPANPDHTGIGLTSQGWNWTVAQLKAQFTTMPDAVPIYVGQMYVTTSGATEIDIDLPEERKAPYLRFAVNGSATIDWGDNSTTDTVTGTSLTTRTNTQHTYLTGGRYTIKITASSGSTVSIYSSDYAYGILNANNSIRTNVYANAIQAIRVGERTTIGDCAFSESRSLIYVTLPYGITSFGQRAFYDNSSIRCITIPSSVITISTYAFCDCNSLLFIAAPPNAFAMGSYMFYRAFCPQIISMMMYATSIGEYAFYYCYSLRKVYIPSTVTSIGKAAFNLCMTVTSFVIPSSVTSIAAQAFSGCYGVKEYHFQRTTPPTLDNTNAFSNISSDCVIYVPRSENQTVLNAYKAETNWSDYASYMQEEPAS